jgi:hypothetical protein
VLFVRTDLDERIARLARTIGRELAAREFNYASLVEEELRAALTPGEKVG